MKSIPKVHAKGLEVVQEIDMDDDISLNDRDWEWDGCDEPG